MIAWLPKLSTKDTAQYLCGFCSYAVLLFGTFCNGIHDHAFFAVISSGFHTKSRAKTWESSRLEWSFSRDCFLRSFLDDFFKVCIVPLLDSNRCRHRWRGFARVVSPGTCCHVSADEHNILLLSGPFEMIGLGPPTRCEWACDQFVFLACVGIANPFVCQRDTIHDKKNTSKRKTTCPRQLSHQS